jgi:RNA polymerase sigma-70 factor (ECF subfamily)
MKRTQKAYGAFVDLIYEHQGILHRICSVYESLPEDREDLYQEILLQSWRSFASFNGRSKFSTWLYRVALNTALTRRRKAPARRDTASTDDVDVVIAVDDRPDSDSDVELLHQSIRELSKLNRAIILLHLEQRSYEEIAEITGLSRTNISVRLVRIKDELRQRLLAKGYREG